MESKSTQLWAFKMAANASAITDEYLKKIDELSERLDVLNASTNQFFLIALGIIIFLMQGGFALLEAGAVR